MSGDIPVISEGAKRLAQASPGCSTARTAAHYANMEAFSEPEAFGDEWTPAPPPRPYRAAGNGGSAHAPAYSASHRRHGDRQMTGLRRIAQAAVVVFLMTLIVFFLHAIGNPVDILIGQDVDQVDRARIIAELGLDKPGGNTWAS